MDRGTWIALIILIVASSGFLLIQASIDAPSTSPASTPSTDNTQTPPPTTTPLADTAANCQTIANTAAQNDQASTGQTTSVIEANFDQKLQQCYYELDIFTSSGNETDLRVAPNDQTVASCTTNSDDTLSCQNQNGAVITEPQFKTLLTTYLGS